MRKQSIISSRLVAILAALAVALVAVAVILSKCGGTAVVEEKNDHVEVTPATIASIKSIGQWEFLTIHDEEYVDTVREGFFSDDGLARIYYGTLRLGLDMSHLDDHAIRMEGDTVLVATLPPVGLLDRHFIDEARTRPFYEKGRARGPLPTRPADDDGSLPDPSQPAARRGPRERGTDPPFSPHGLQERKNSV